MAAGPSAWPRYPGYRVDLVPWRGRGRVRLGERVLAESDACLIVFESDHAPQLYFPEAGVAWEHFQATDHHTICPFKGEADYWSVAMADPPLENVVWAYRKPFDEVAGLAGYVAFYCDRLEVELVESASRRTRATRSSIASRPGATRRTCCVSSTSRRPARAASPRRPTRIRRSARSSRSSGTRTRAS